MPNNSNKEESPTIFQKKFSLDLIFKHVPLNEKLFFTEYLRLMIKSGIPIARAIMTLSRQTENEYFALILRKISSDVESGISLSSSLKNHGQTFGNLFINMIAAGETSGRLEEVLNQLHIQLKKQQDVEAKIKSAAAYPIIIILAMIGVSGFLMIYVMPVLIQVFSDFNATLPLPTRIVIATSNFLTAYWFLVLLIVIVVIGVYWYSLKNRQVRYAFEKVELRLPIFSSIIKKINLARFARSLSMLLKTDIPVIQSFSIVAATLGNVHYRQTVEEMAEMLRKGNRISLILENYPWLFPPVVSELMLVGEETGELDNVLTQLAEFYEGEIKNLMEDLPAIIEPLLILGLGIGVGIIATAIVMPIYGLAQVM